MTDKEYRIQKNRIRKLSEKWIGSLGLRWWTITHEYFREEQPPEITNYKPPTINGRWTCVFDVSTDYYYKIAHINCYLLNTRYVSDENLEEYYLHELMHILVKPMQHQQTKKEEELVATSLAQAFLWTEHSLKNTIKRKMLSSFSKKNKNNE